MTQLANLSREGRKGYARCKLPQGEFTIRTIKPPELLETAAVQERIARIIQRSRDEYCRKRSDVEQEIRARQQRENPEPPQQIPPQPTVRADDAAFPLRRNVSLE